MLNLNIPQRGKNLEFDWQNTSLGIRMEGEAEFTYVNLQGPPGEWAAETVSQVEAEAGTSETRRAWTALRVWQSIKKFLDQNISIAGTKTLTDPTAPTNSTNGALNLPGIALGGGRIFAANIFSGRFVAGTQTAESFQVSGYNSSNQPEITNLISGSSTGTVIAGASNSHIVVNIRANDILDSLAVCSNSFLAANEPKTVDRVLIRVFCDGKILMPNLPTSSAGLTAGNLWRDSNGFLRIV